jgi:tungstate transport system substrate-binding protein
MRRAAGVVIVIVLVSLSAVGFAEDRIRMATTTSTDNSGLLAVLLPPFEGKYGLKVDVIAVGTGKALKLGENGDVDIVLVHAREAEDEFVEKGFGVNRRDVMYNDFIIVGPSDDPANVSKISNAAEALSLITASGTEFISRGDDSGTHKKEKELWKDAGIEPKGKWYVEAGQGMGAVLQMADEKQAYTLTDRGTWLAYAAKLELKVLLEGDARLFNPYGIIAVNPALHPHVKYMESMLLIAWFTSPEGQKIIGGFKVNDQALFVPSAVPLRKATN